QAAEGDLVASYASVAGDCPARCRLVITDTSGHDQLGVLWAVRSRQTADQAPITLDVDDPELTGDLEFTGVIPSGEWLERVSITAGHVGWHRVFVRFEKSDVVDAQVRLRW